MSPALDEAEPGLAQCLAHSLVCRSFWIPEHFRTVFSRNLRQFHPVRLSVAADSEREVEVGVEIVGHGVAFIKVVRHDKIPDVCHHLLGPVGQTVRCLDVVVVDVSLYLAGFSGESLEVRFHQPDKD